MKTWTVWTACALAMAAACSANVVDEAGAPPEMEEEERPFAEPNDATCQDAIAEVQGCMDREEWELQNIALLAYQQTEHGPCGSCHNGGLECVWIAFNDEEMFSKWSSHACVGERLFDCELDAAGNVINVVNAHDIFSSLEGKVSHPQTLIGAELADGLNRFLDDTIERWRNGACRAP